MRITGSTNEMRSLSFNQDASCFACATDKGFAIFDVDDPPDLRFQQDKFPAGLQLVEILYKSNIVAFVGNSTKYPPLKVMIWDDCRDRVVVELGFHTPVMAIRLRRDLIVVVREGKTEVFNMSDFKPERSFVTCPNPNGLVALCTHPEKPILVLPDKKVGHVRIAFLGRSDSEDVVCRAHDHAISQVAINAQGTQFATTSERGTLVRVFDCETGAQLHELRRGSQKAKIFSLAFHGSLPFLALTSEKGTVHLWCTEKAKPANKKSNFSFMASYVPSGTWFNSSWSFAQFTVPAKRSICAFGPKNTIIVITSSGEYHKYRFDVTKRTAVKELLAVFLKSKIAAAKKALLEEKTDVDMVDAERGPPDEMTRST